MAWTALANVTLGTATSTVTFSSISQSYRDLVLIVNGTSQTSSTNIYLRFNSDTGTNYSWVTMSGNGSTTFSGSSSGETYTGSNTFNSGDSVVIFNILDYSATDKHKTVLGRGNTAATAVDARAGRWASTSAITSITILLGSLGFNSGTSFALYGVSA